MSQGARQPFADRRPGKDEDGFTLVEVIVSLGILVVVMLGSAGFFISSLKKTSGTSQRQAAVTLATQMMEYTRNVPNASLLAGRDSATVQSMLIAVPGTVDLSQDVTNAYNSDPAATATSSQVVPISYTSLVGGAAYTTRTYIDRCYLSTTSSVCGSVDSGAGWMYRISAAVAWNLGAGQRCLLASGVCEYVATSLRDPGSDPCFNSNTSLVGCSNVSGSTSTPLISSISPSPVLVGSTTTLTIFGSGFMAGATVVPDAYGTVANTTFVSPTQMTVSFRAGTTSAAVGTRTLKVVNPDTGTALGTVSVSPSTVSISSVNPAAVVSGATTTLTISGTGFLSNTVASVDPAAGSVDATTFVSPTSLTVSLTAASGTAAVGSHTLTVTNPDGPSDSGAFTITQAPVALTSVSPASVLTGTSKAMTLTGTGFAPGITVSVDSGGGTLGAVTLTGTTRLTFNFTGGTVGTHTFTVTNKDGGRAARTFAVSAPPTLSGFTLSPSKQGSNSTITVSGTGFQSGATYSVNVSGYVVNPTITVLSPTQLTFSYNPLPAAGTYSYSSTVTNPDGGTGSRSGSFVVTP